MGLLLIQMAKNAGAAVIGTVSTQEKAELALVAGADEVILYSETDFEAEVKHITDGTSVTVVSDSVGKTTFDKSIECLQRFGYMVLYGNASGPVTQFNPATLGPKGSLFL
ncbi:MAG: zinc-binding dehydrogenase, partial [Rhizobiaceae bacterium]|nr:zinc-binding dehydrogenase [Rhizobiaceae bacterium]